MIKGLSHVAIRTRDLMASVRFYSEVLGMREAFRMNGADCSLATVYMYIAPGEYLELFANGTREPVTGSDVLGMCHICLEVEDIHTACEAVRAKGGPIDRDVCRGKSLCWMFWTHDPDGTSIEVMQMPPESLQAQADRRFSD